MKQLADYRQRGELMATMPGELMPPIAIVDYSAIDSGLGGPPYSVRGRAWTEHQIGPASTVQVTTPGATVGATRFLKRLMSCFRTSPPKCCVYFHYREHDRHLSQCASRLRVRTVASV